MRYCIIENEFGHAGVDGDLLTNQGFAVKEISGGCVCCTLKVTLHNMLEMMSHDMDHVILEPSGLFCGDDLLDIIHAPDLQGKVQLGMWVGVLDPMAIPLMNEQDLAVLYSELVFAGSVLMSKTDVASAEDLMRVRPFLETMFDGAPLPALFTMQTHPDDVSLFHQMQNHGAVMREHQRVRFDHTNQFQSTVLTPKQAYTEAQINDFLTHTFALGTHILRIKGMLRADDGGVWLINATPKCLQVSKSDQDALPALNIIGRGLSRKTIRQIWEG